MRKPKESVSFAGAKLKFALPQSWFSQIKYSLAHTSESHQGDEFKAGDSRRQAWWKRSGNETNLLYTYKSCSWLSWLIRLRVHHGICTEDECEFTACSQIRQIGSTALTNCGRKLRHKLANNWGGTKVLRNSRVGNTASNNNKTGRTE